MSRAAYTAVAEAAALRAYVEQLRGDVTHALNVQSRKLRRQLLLQAMAKPVPPPRDERPDVPEILETVGDVRRDDVIVARGGA